MRGSAVLLACLLVAPFAGGLGHDGLVMSGDAPAGAFFLDVDEVDWTSGSEGAQVRIDIDVNCDPGVAVMAVFEVHGDEVSPYRFGTGDCTGQNFVRTASSPTPLRFLIVVALPEAQASKFVRASIDGRPVSIDWAILREGVQWTRPVVTVDEGLPPGALSRIEVSYRHELERPGLHLSQLRLVTHQPAGYLEANWQVDDAAERRHTFVQDATASASAMTQVDSVVDVSLSLDGIDPSEVQGGGFAWTLPFTLDELGLSTREHVGAGESYDDRSWGCLRPSAERFVCL